MIVELVTFRAPPGADWNAILEGARGTLPHWGSNAQLVRKHYVLSEDGTTCGGIYLWPSREAAEQAHNAEWRVGVAKRTGAPPSISYFALQMLLDNEAGTVTEWSATGQKTVRQSR